MLRLRRSVAREQPLTHFVDNLLKIAGLSQEWLTADKFGQSYGATEDDRSGRRDLTRAIPTRMAVWCGRKRHVVGPGESASKPL